MNNHAKYISLAEIAYKSGHIRQAIRHAKAGLRRCESQTTSTAFRIFIARCYSKLGEYDKSNIIYRGLLNEKNYLPPIIMGLLYNNLKTSTLDILKLYVR